jgi:DNA primase
MKRTYEDFARSYFQVVSQGGSELNCKCPWHSDNAPSLRVNIDSGLFICLGCGKKGHLKRLAEGEGATIGAQEVNVLDYVLNAVSRPERSERVLSEAFLTPLMMTTDYWTNIRRLTSATVLRFQLGQDLVKSTATIPFRGEGGELLGIIERQLGGGKGPKYHYPMGFKKNLHLFGSWMLDSSTDSVCIVEGPVDALAMWDAGIPTVAISGSSISAQQVSVLRKLNVHHAVLFTDNDEAGSHAIEQMVESLAGTGILWSLARYGNGWPTDPAALNMKQRRMAYRHALSQLNVTTD